MTVVLSDFHAAVTRVLARPHLPAESIEALRSSDPAVSGPVALRLLRHPVTPVLLVVEVDW